MNFIIHSPLLLSPQIPKISGERERERERERMKGSVARHLTVQKLGHVSFKPLQQQSSFSISLSDSFRFQSLLESEAQSADSLIPSSSPPLDIDIDSNVDDKDFILSQDFFCTPDYITPDGQYISNSLDCNKENIACPKSPEKIKTVKSKRQRQDGFNLSCHEQVVELAKDTFGTDEINTEKAIGTEPQKNHSYVSPSAVALRCRVMPPPCIKNLYQKDASETDIDPFGNQRSKCAVVMRAFRGARVGIFPTIIGGDGLSRYWTDFHEIENLLLDAKRKLGEILSAFEFLDSNSMDLREA
ncbi:unnamed protein product [Camellia sinensis]